MHETAVWDGSGKQFTRSWLDLVSVAKGAGLLWGWESAADSSPFQESCGVDWVGFSNQAVFDSDTLCKKGSVRERVQIKPSV